MVDSNLAKSTLSTIKLTSLAFITITCKVKFLLILNCINKLGLFISLKILKSLFYIILYKLNLLNLKNHKNIIIVINNDK